MSAAAAAATATVCFGSSFVDFQSPAAELGSIESFDSFLGGGVIVHLHETEAAWAARFTVGDNVDSGHLAVLGKEGPQILLGDIVRTVSNINIRHQTVS